MENSSNIKLISNVVTKDMYSNYNNGRKYVPYYLLSKQDKDILHLTNSQSLQARKYLDYACVFYSKKDNVIIIDENFNQSRKLELEDFKHAYDVVIKLELNEPNLIIIPAKGSSTCYKYINDKLKQPNYCKYFSCYKQWECK